MDDIKLVFDTYNFKLNLLYREYIPLKAYYYLIRGCFEFLKKPKKNLK